jgi:DNA-binding transcriptional regulator/RsmH inhibitor MraZ
MELETLALSGYYGRKLDYHCRIPFPPTFKDEIEQKIGGDFYLLIGPSEIDGIKFIRGTPASKEYYDGMVKMFNKRKVDDLDRKYFFRVLKVSLDKQRRIPLTTYLTEFVGFQKRGIHYFFGYGNHFDIYRLDDIPSLVDEEIANLILGYEQSK